MCSHRIVIDRKYYRRVLAPNTHARTVAELASCSVYDSVVAKQSATRMTLFIVADYTRPAHEPHAHGIEFRHGCDAARAAAVVNISSCSRAMWSADRGARDSN